MASKDKSRSEFGRKHANYRSFRLSYVTTYGQISNLNVSFFALNALHKRFLYQYFTGEKAINSAWL